MGGHDQLRGPARIIPAVPRKYERTCTKTSVKDHVPQTAQLKIRATSESVQDFGIEKHGKLPPPFYPANSSPSRSSLPSYHGSPTPNETSDSGSGHLPAAIAEDGTPVALSLSQNGYSQWNTPESAYAGNPTPPDEESPTRFNYSINAKTFHPQPTPPSDLTPPPSQSSSSYQRYPYPYNISFYPPETPEFVDSPSSAQSMYHGYSYVPSLTDANFSTDIYAPLDYTGSIDTSRNGFSSIECHDPFSEVVSPPLWVGGEIDRSTQPEADAKPASMSLSVLEQDNRSPANGLPQSSTQVKPILSELAQESDTTSSRPLDLSANDEEARAAEDYQVWRRTALDDLQSVPQEVWREQMVMPSFFLQHFNSPRYADCRIRINAPDKSKPGFDLLLHSILLTYSPMLAAKLETSEPASDGLRPVMLDASGEFITPDAIESALYTCYGRPLYHFIGTTADITVTNAKDSALWMENTLAFVAAGQLLELPSVIARGSQIATRILNWDNIEKALSFLVHSRASFDTDGADSISAFAEKDSSIPQPLEVAGASPETASLMTSCLQLLLDRFPKHWKVNNSAPSLSSIDRLPKAPVKRQTTPKPRLSQIKFGDLSPEEPRNTERLSDQDTLLSSILISLPFDLVQRIILELQERLSFEGLQSLVTERESRRRYVIQEDPMYSRSTPSLVFPESLVWEEYVESVTDGEGSSPRISRRRTNHGTTSNS